MNLRTLRCATLAAGLASYAVAHGASVLDLTLKVTPNASNTGGTWDAFADVEDPSSAGLHGIQFDVKATGGATLGTAVSGTPSSFNDLPTGLVAIPSGRGTQSVSAGFHNFFGATDVMPGLDEQFMGAQDNLYHSNPGTGHTNIIFGFGLPGQSGNLAGDTMLTPPWSFPAMIADGTYTGSAGSISISGSPTVTTLMPDQATVVNSGTIGFATHSPDTVNGETVPIGMMQRLPGDVNDDGKVGFDDLVVLARNYGKHNAVWEDGDFNADSIVGFDDLVILARNYGKTATAAELAALDPSVRAEVAQAFAQVPEPSLTPLLLLAGPSLLRRRRGSCR